MYISDNNIGVYDDVMYIHFGGSIYKADEKALSVTQVANGMYNVYFLEECIVAMKKKPDRLDEMIKIIPADDTIIIRLPYAFYCTTSFCLHKILANADNYKEVMLL